MSGEAPKVVSLHGDEIRLPGEPCADLIEKLADLLEKARSGEIDGMVATIHHSDDCTSGCMSGKLTRSMIGMIEILKLDMCERAR